MPKEVHLNPKKAGLFRVPRNAAIYGIKLKPYKLKSSLLNNQISLVKGGLNGEVICMDYNSYWCLAGIAFNRHNNTCNIQQLACCPISIGLRYKQACKKLFLYKKEVRIV